MIINENVPEVVFLSDNFAVNVVNLDRQSGPRHVLQLRKPLTQQLHRAPRTRSSFNVIVFADVSSKIYWLEISEVDHDFSAPAILL